jgi:hypothetical protein
LDIGRYNKHKGWVSLEEVGVGVRCSGREYEVNGWGARMTRTGPWRR